MAQIITGISKSKILTILDTYNHTTLNASMYKVAIRLTESPPSGMIINIQQNGVTKAGFSVPSSVQNHIELQVVMNCAVSDLISIILSSSNANDQRINDLSGILTITQGSF